MQPSSNPTQTPRRCLAPLALTALLTCAPTLSQADDPESTRAFVQRECAQCHGVDGNSIAPAFPKLAGLQHEYLAKQLNDFRSGRRQNEIMAPVIETLTAAQVDDLADYFSRQRRAMGTTYLKGMVPLGRRIYHDGIEERGVPACAGCHKPDGAGTPRSPLLAGQHSAYVLAQLRAFHSDQRDNDRARLMRTTAGRMTESDMIAVSEYIAGMDAIPAQP